MKNQDFERENSFILSDVIKRVVNKYHSVVIVNDCDENLSTIFAFFDKLGVHDIDYIMNINQEDICTMEHGYNISGASCSIQKVITIKASDLTFYPCFKAANMSILKYGRIDYMSLEIIPENIELAALIYFYNPTYSNPKCDRCKYAVLCHKNCYIDNYLVNKDVMQPVVEKCSVYKKEIDEIIIDNQDLKRLLIERRNSVECTR